MHLDLMKCKYPWQEDDDEEKEYKTASSFLDEWVKSGAIETWFEDTGITPLTEAEITAIEKRIQRDTTLGRIRSESSTRRELLDYHVTHTFDDEHTGMLLRSTYESLMFGPFPLKSFTREYDLRNGWQIVSGFKIFPDNLFDGKYHGPSNGTFPTGAAEADEWIKRLGGFGTGKVIGIRVFT